MTYRLRNILIAVGLAAVAAVLTIVYATNVRRDAEQGEGLVSVFVAARDIVEGTSGSEAVEDDLVTTKEVARRSVVPGAISNPAQIEGLVASETIYSGEQVTARRFQPVAEQGIVAQLKGNMRAFQLPGDPHQLMQGTLKEGDRVDVVTSIKFRVTDVDAADGSRVGGDFERTASRVVLRDIVVLRAAAVPESDSDLTEGIDNTTSAVLAVSDAQAQKLFFVAKNGDWSLQLRPAADATDSPESVETVETVLGDGLKPAQLQQLLAGGFGERTQ
jgi:Flp pilus assembly protein CpaB